MKLNSPSNALALSLLLVFFTLSILNSTSARTDPFLLPLDREQIVGRDDMVKMDGPTQVALQHHSGERILKEEEAWDLMGLEYCNDGDEQCLERRLLSEAHLDYIYTQHQKP